MSGQHQEPGRGPARRQPRHARRPRPADIYGDFTLPELEAQDQGLRPRSSGLEADLLPDEPEGEFVEHLHRLPERADAAIVNAGAWTHYSWAIRDALEFTGVPAVEVHISDISQARGVAAATRSSTGLDLLIGQIYGKGADGYREALELIAERLGQ